jgi:hypothetical protein
MNKLCKFLQVLGSNNTSTLVNSKAHGGNFSTNLFHKLNDKIHKLVFVHLLGMEVSNKEADVVIL